MVFELTHLATLYHDDVMDEAAVRRGAPSANSRWGNSVAILTGDFLFARASDMLADLGPEAVRIQAQHVRPAGHRPDRRDRRPAPGEDPIDALPAVLADKTGSLIATSARFGAHVRRRRRRRWSTRCTAFGETIGVAFQLSDDLLDIASETASPGKTPGTDLREGVPPCRCCTRWPATTRPRPGCASCRPARSPTTPCTPRPWSCCASRRRWSGPTAVLRRYADRARARLDAVPDGRVRDALEALCDYVATRTS